MKLSIITPSFNQGEFIERTIQSVLNQNYPDLEYLVFDGGSTDSTVEILKKYEKDLKWVSKKDRGQADAVNQGILASTGDIIGWLNSDDIYYSGSFDNVMEYFKNHPECQILYGQADHIGIDDKPFEEYPTESWDFERLMYTCFICQPTVFFRRSIFDKYGLLDINLNYCMDYEFWLRLGKQGEVLHYLPQKSAGSRLYQTNKTLGSRKKVHEEINIMYINLFGVAPFRWISNYAHCFVEGAKRNFVIKIKLFILITFFNFQFNKKFNFKDSFNLIF